MTPRDIIGAHPLMQRLMKRVATAAKARSTVLIVGETGVGKELVAESLHRLGPVRSKGPLVKINCAALAENLLESELFGHEKGAFTGALNRRIGKFELADRGTLFLDEIGELPLKLQVKLLRFLQEREIERVGGNETIRLDVRVVTATNRDLRGLVEDKLLREDLFYRLRVIELQVPPLRTRPSDIPLLASAFLERFNAENDKAVTGFTPAAEKSLQAYSWPGNVRELEHVIEQAVVFAESDTIGEADLPIHPPRENLDSLHFLVPGVTLAELERFAIIRTLDSVGGSPTKAAAILGVSRRTIQYRMREWGIGSYARVPEEPTGPSPADPLPSS